MNTKQNFAGWLKEAIAKSDTNQQQLAKNIDVTPAYISRLCSGKTVGTPDVQVLIRIAQTLKRDPEEVFAVAGKSSSLVVKDPASGARYIPVITWEQATKVNANTVPTDYAPLRSLLVPNAGNRLFAICVDDESLSPFANAGEFLVIDPDQNPPPDKYAAVASRTTEKLEIRQCKTTGKDTVYLSVGRTVDIKTALDLYIIGRVVGKTAEL